MKFKKLVINNKKLLNSKRDIISNNNIFTISVRFMKTNKTLNPIALEQEKKQDGKNEISEENSERTPLIKTSDLNEALPVLNSNNQIYEDFRTKIKNVEDELKSNNVATSEVNTNTENLQNSITAEIKSYENAESSSSNLREQFQRMEEIVEKESKLHEDVRNAFVMEDIDEIIDNGVKAQNAVNRAIEERDRTTAAINWLQQRKNVYTLASFALWVLPFFIGVRGRPSNPPVQVPTVNTSNPNPPEPNNVTQVDDTSSSPDNPFSGSDGGGFF